MKEREKFVPPYPLKTPVLFLIFKRLDTTKQVFEMIRQAKPPKLYVAADGPRDWIEGEAERVKAVRDYVMSNIDWSCEVKTLFREKNLGCGRAVSEAISWFFENEEMGIILEDDVLPSLSFFWFCEKLLEKYKDNKVIGAISGCNFQDGIWRGDGDYYFSIYNHVWGWASWRDRWESYDFAMESFRDNSFIDELFDNKKARRYWKRIFAKMKKHEIDTWDYQWTFTLWRNKQLAILPNLNLVSNIGFGEDAAHTKDYDSKFLNLRRFEIDVVELKHPRYIVRNMEADEYTFRRIFAPLPIIIRILNKLRRLRDGIVKVLYTV